MGFKASFLWKSSIASLILADNVNEIFIECAE